MFSSNYIIFLYNYTITQNVCSQRFLNCNIPLYLLQNVIAARAVDVIKSVDADTQPLYLYLPFQSVHAPLQVTMHLC